MKPRTVRVAVRVRDQWRNVTPALTYRQGLRLRSWLWALRIKAGLRPAR